MITRQDLRAWLYRPAITPGRAVDLFGADLDLMTRRRLAEDIVRESIRNMNKLAIAETKTLAGK